MKCVTKISDSIVLYSLQSICNATPNVFFHLFPAFVFKLIWFEMNSLITADFGIVDENGTEQSWVVWNWHRDSYEIMECNPINLDVLRSFVLILRLSFESDSLKQKQMLWLSQIDLRAEQQHTQKNIEWQYKDWQKQNTHIKCNVSSGILSRLLRICAIRKNICLIFH